MTFTAASAAAAATSCGGGGYCGGSRNFRVCALAYNAQPKWCSTADLNATTLGATRVSQG